MKLQGSGPRRLDPFSHFSVHPTHRSSQGLALSTASLLTNSLEAPRPRPFSLPNSMVVALPTHRDAVTTEDAKRTRMDFVGLQGRPYERFQEQGYLPPVDRK